MRARLRVGNPGIRFRVATGPHLAGDVTAAYPPLSAARLVAEGLAEYAGPTVEVELAEPAQPEAEDPQPGEAGGRAGLVFV